MYMDNLTKKALLGLLVALGCWAGTAEAQRARYKPQVHQLELQLAGTEAFSGREGLTAFADLPLAAHVLQGVRYQYAHSLPTAFRIGFSQTRSTWGSAEGPGTYTSYEAELREMGIQLGYLRRKHIGASQLYLGTELEAGRSQINESGQAGGGTTLFANGYQYQFLGAQALAGMRYFFSPTLSLGLEANIGYRRYQLQETGSEILPFLFFDENTLRLGLSASAAVHFVPLKKRCSCPKPR